eukprot:6213664-Pleurochrysis_carterae.AAC.2
MKKSSRAGPAADYFKFHSKKSMTGNAMQIARRPNVSAAVRSSFRQRRTLYDLVTFWCEARVASTAAPAVTVPVLCGMTGISVLIGSELLVTKMLHSDS